MKSQIKMTDDFEYECVINENIRFIYRNSEPFVKIEFTCKNINVITFNLNQIIMYKDKNTKESLDFRKGIEKPKNKEKVINEVIIQDPVCKRLFIGYSSITGFNKKCHVLH